MNQGFFEVSHCLPPSLPLTRSLAHSLAQGEILAISGSASANDRLFLSMSEYDDGYKDEGWEIDGVHLMTFHEEPEESD